MIRTLCTRVSLVLSLWLLCSATGQGDTVSFEHIDQHARNAPARVTHDVAELATYLAKPAANDLEKVRGFYVWIAENIAYDVRAFTHYNPSRYQRVALEEVLRRRKAVCQGYAELFQAMCQHHSIPCHLVPGYSKGLNSRGQDFTRGDHAWNAVQLNGEWHLLDVTWGSGGLDDQLSFVKQFNDDYFLTDPRTFVQDHLPLDPVWQLLDCPVGMASFIAGQEAVQAEIISSSAACSDSLPGIEDIEQVNLNERELASAERAYAFNPLNTLVLTHAYMNRAHHLMSNVPQRLSSRTAIEEALVVQEEALTYLEKAKSVLDRTKRGDSQAEKNVLEQNIKNSRNNLKGLRQALQP